MDVTAVRARRSNQNRDGRCPRQRHFEPGVTMIRSIHILLAAGAASALLASCASRPKSPPMAPPAGLAESQPSSEPQSSAPPTSDLSLQSAQDQLAATAGERMYFAFDSHSVDVDARDTLRRQAEWLAANPGVRARIEGHADERGTREYNMALGARRAAAARQTLIERGVEASRLETLSFGKERPLDPGSNEAAWAKNRNAGTVVIGLGAP